MTWIAALSSSSPQSSVAVIHVPTGERWGEIRSAPIQASGALLTMLQCLLEERGLALRDIQGFVADGGPGSFVGTRVAVMLAKVLAYQLGVPAARVPASSIMGNSPFRAIPHRRQEWFVCGPEGTRLTNELPDGVVGYGLPDEIPPTYPNVLNLALGELEWQPAEQLVPGYLAEPAISTPKIPYRPVTG